MIKCYVSAEIKTMTVKDIATHPLNIPPGFERALSCNSLFLSAFTIPLITPESIQLAEGFWLLPKVKATVKGQRFGSI